MIMTIDRTRQKTYGAGVTVNLKNLACIWRMYRLWINHSVTAVPR